MSEYSSSASRRQFLMICTAVGVASGFFAGALYALAATKRDEKVTGDMIDEAAALAGIAIPPDKREAMLSQLNEQRQAYDAIRQLRLPNEVPPAFRFDPVIPGSTAPPTELEPVRTPLALGDPPAVADAEIPKDLEKLAYATVRELGVLIKQRKISARVRREYDRRYDAAALDALGKMGVEPQVVELPDLPLDAIALLLNAEENLAQGGLHGLGSPPRRIILPSSTIRPR
jgi:hypothetical protein